jgi:hypothetical protein
MVDKLTDISPSISRSFDLFFDLIIFKVEKAASHRYDMDKGSKISKDIFTIVGGVLIFKRNPKRIKRNVLKF